MRQVLETSDKPLNSLENELKTLKLYLDLEALRFDFEYVIQINDSLDQDETYVPTLLLQPYVENAIIHGLAPKPVNRKLLIDIQPWRNGVHIAVEDNGIGRSITAAPLSSSQKHRSMGMALNLERLRAFSNIYGSIEEPEVIDLHDIDQQPCGTRC